MREEMGKMRMWIRKNGLLAAFFAFFIFFLTPQANGQEGADVCVSCHQGLEGNLADPVKGWEQSAHREAGVRCKDCHGGNSSIAALAMKKAMGFKGTPKAKDIPALCAKCHADVRKMRPYNLRTDQYAEYQTSIHGQRLAKGDSRVATCSSCHGAHEVRKKNDPLSAVYHTRVPETCAKCHADPKLMKGYKIPTDQLAEFNKSYHGKILRGEISGKNPLLAPNCATCHGIHGATPPGVKEVEAVCGNCHTTIARYFRQGPHEKAVRETGIPKCITCHGNHDIPYPSLNALTGEESGQCGACHDQKSTAYGKAQKMKSLLEAAENAIRKNQKSIERLKVEQLEVSKLEGKVTEASAKLTQAKPLTHAVEVVKLEELTGQSMKISEEDQKLIVKLEKGLEQRKKIGITLLFLIGLVILFLYLKNQSLKKSK